VSVEGQHIPVLLEAVVEALSPIAGGVYVDGTYGGGGYSKAVLAVADCVVLGIDRDPDAMQRAWDHAGVDPRLKPAPGCFSELDLAARAAGYEYVDGVMLDLGVSSHQLDEAERGFSFMRDGPLDMRMGKRGPSAADAVNYMTEKDLASIFHFYGEESASRRIAKAIVKRRDVEPFTRTLELANLVDECMGGRRGKKTHPATKTFQALRLFVNDELGELIAALSSAEEVLRPSGRLVVVTFHSLEDRIVKNYLRERAGMTRGTSRHAPEKPEGAPPSFDLVARKAIEPSDEEVSGNPRSRSSRLRWAIRSDAPAWGSGAKLRDTVPTLDALEALIDR